LVYPSAVATNSETIAQMFVKAKTDINITRVTCSNFTGENFENHYLETFIRAILHRLGDVY